MPNHKKNTVKTPIQQKRTKNVIFKTVFGSSFLIQSVQLKKNEYLESFGAQLRPFLQYAHSELLWSSIDSAI